MLRYEISVLPEQVVFVKGLVEAHEGLATVFAEHGGELVLAAAPGREAEVEELLRDLKLELRASACGTARVAKRPRREASS